MPDPIPDNFTGLWRREVIVLPDGRRDSATHVLWLQTRGLFADIRVPADRPKRANAQSFGNYDDAELITLAAMQGFAGDFTVETKDTGTSFCRWRRKLDFQPPGGPPDEADCHFEDGLLIETGIHGNYREDWRRETAPGAPVASFVLEEDEAGRSGLLVLAGDHFIEILDRPAALPKAASLADLVQADLAAGARERALGRLEMKIAYGRIGDGWRVALATFPWLEGTPLFTACRFTGDQLKIRPDRRVWRLVDSSLPAAELARLFPQRGP